MISFEFVFGFSDSVKKLMTKCFSKKRLDNYFTGLCYRCGTDSLAMVNLIDTQQFHEWKMIKDLCDTIQHEYLHGLINELNLDYKEPASEKIIDKLQGEIYNLNNLR